MSRALALAPAPTLNTAPVHEFRCLYTRDLHKKAKKWHDGSLKFHTFNRRVMVYDEAKNYIGDLHYREADTFDEGLELQLDRGVNVEVGERVGESHTDLAGIVERPRPRSKQAAPSSDRPHDVAIIHRASSALRSQRPKSLLEVLGPSQGRWARSRLPLQSPYEQAHVSSLQMHDEPACKRRRVSLDKENARDPVLLPRNPPTHRSPPRPIPTEPIPAPRRRLHVPAREACQATVGGEGEDEDEGDAVQSSPARQANEMGRRSRNPTSALPAGQPRPNSHSIRRQDAPDVRGAMREKIWPVSRETHHPSTSMSPSRSAERRRRTGPCARLRLGRPKAKSTLTYLLPFLRLAHRQNAGRPSATTSTNRRCIDGDRASEFLTNSPSPSSPEPQPNRDIGVYRPITISPVPSPGFPRLDETLNAVSRPLICEESVPRLESPCRPTLVESDLSRFYACSGTPPPDVAVAAMTTATNADGGSPPQLDHGGAGRLSPRLKVSSRTMAGQISPRAISSANRSGQTLSSSSSPESRDAALSRDSDLDKPPPQRDLEMASRPDRNPIRSWSISEVSALDEETSDVGKERVPESATVETGPWSNDEAFLLFDWWPPGITKPAYAPSTSLAAERVPVVSRVGAGLSEGITTARHVLRDDPSIL